jgi:hypothetical protein
VNKIGQLLHTSAFSFGNKLYFGSQLPWTTWLSRARDLFPSYRKNFFFWFELNFFCWDHILIFLLYLSRAVHHTVFLVSRTSNREERVLEVNHHNDWNLLSKQNTSKLVFAFSLMTQKYYYKKSAQRFHRILKHFLSRHVGTKFSFGLGSVKSFKNSLNFKLKFTE